MAEGTVDSLVIEVSSSAASAARGIDALAQSLGALSGKTGGAAESLQKVRDSVSGIDHSSLAAVASGLQALGAVKVSSTMGKNMAALADALARMPETAANCLRGVADAMAGFKGVSLSKSTVDAFSRMPEAIRAYAQTDMATLTAKLKEFNAQLEPTTKNLQALAAAYNALPKSLRTFSAAARSVSTSQKYLASNSVAVNESMQKLSNSIPFSRFNSFASMVRNVASAVKRFSSSLMDAVNSAGEYNASLNAYQSSLGQYADSALDAAKDVNSVLSVGLGSWMKVQTRVNNVAEGLGIAGDKAATMSGQLAQLANDLSSFYSDVDASSAATKLQAALAGQTRGVKALGYDLSDSAMSAYLLSHGIDAEVSSLSNADKAILRYNLLLTQQQQVQGQTARSLETPAGQLRVLRAQFAATTKTIGEAFIPILVRIMPYAIAAAKAIRILVQSMASFFGIDTSGTGEAFGYSTPMDESIDLDDALSVGSGDMDTSGIDDVSGSLEDAEDSADKANKSLKEYQNTLMGFDQINKLGSVPDASSSSKSSGASSAGSGSSSVPSLGSSLDLPIEQYDMLEDLTSDLAKRTDELAQKMADSFKRILPVVGAVGGAIAAWRIRDSLLRSTGLLAKALRAPLATSQELANSLAKAGKVRLAGVVGDMGIRMQTAADALSRMVKYVAPFAATVGIIAVHFYNLYQNSENFRRGLSWISDQLSKLPPITEVIQGAWEWLCGVIDGAVQAVVKFVESLGIDLSFLDPVFEWFSWLGDALADVGKAINEVFDLQWSDAMMVAAAGIAAVSGHPGFAAIIGIAEGVSLAIRAIGWATSPVIDSVDALADVSEDTAERFGTSLDSMEDAIELLDEQQFSDAVVTQEDVERITRDVEDIRDTILNNLDAERNEELAQIDALSAFLTPEKKQEMIDAVNRHFDDLKGQVQEGSDEILAINATALAEGREKTDEENSRIRQIMDTQYKYLLESAGASDEELSSIEEKRLNNEQAAALRAASNVVTAAKDARDQRKQDAEDDHDATMKMLDRQFYEEGILTQDEYDNLVRIADEAYEDAYKSADENYDEIVRRTKEGLGELSDNIDYETGEIKQRWEGWGEEIKRVWDEICNALSQGIDMESTMRMNVEIAEAYGAVPAYAGGGLPTRGQLFVAREAGPEMVGTIGGQSAVANNSQIVEGIQSGVFSAMMQAAPMFSQQDSGDVTLVLRVDSEDLARANARGQASAARRGQIIPELSIA